MSINGYDALRSAAAWIDLSGRGLIRVTGEDRARLLHAMCTNHVQGMQPGDGLYAFFLNAQGRILADTYVYALENALLLDTEPEIAAKVIAHLDKYIIADDVTLADETAQWAVIAVEGPESIAAATNLDFAVPEKKYHWLSFGSGFVVRVAGSTPDGLRVFLPIAERDELIRKLEAAGIPQAPADQARIVRLENGIPRYGDEITDRFLVAETQALHGVHFNKGCYLGQEIVERVRSRGQVHRLLTPIRISGKTPVERGAKLVANGAESAEVMSSAYSPALGEVVGLAYIRTEALENRPVLTVAGSEPPLEARVP